VFALCVEASPARGMGHLFRALALAEALDTLGARSLICVNDDDRAAAVLRDRGLAWRTVPLANPALDWEGALIKSQGVRVWVDDRLDTDARHARRVLDTDARLATFDDRGSGAALADLNVVAVPLTDGERVAGRRVLSGLQFLVLDAAVQRWRRVRQRCESVVVSMGGSDTYGVTVDVVRALRARGRAATVVLGPGFQHDTALTKVIGDGIQVKRSIPSLAEEFAHHDLAVTAGGITPFEANAAGLPCIVIATETWEVRSGEVLADLGGCIYAGWRDEIDFATLDAPLPIETMSRAALAGVPADGAARVAAELLRL
jgi:spore coat polysaccharide biosynthesis predicted glycosyltransferase SpsG